MAIFALKEIGFPEYYFAVSYIPTLLIFLGIISYFTKNNTSILLLITLFLLFENTQKYSFAETSFSLSRKMNIAKVMKSLDAPIDLRFIMAPGREGGIKEFYTLYGGIIKSDSKTKVIVTENDKGNIGESATLMGKYGDIRAFKVAVQ